VRNEFGVGESEGGCDAEADVGQACVVVAGCGGFFAAFVVDGGERGVGAGLEEGCAECLQPAAFFVVANERDFETPADHVISDEQPAVGLWSDEEAEAGEKIGELRDDRLVLADEVSEDRPSGEFVVAVGTQRDELEPAEGAEIIFEGGLAGVEADGFAAAVVEGVEIGGWWAEPLGKLDGFGGADQRGLALDFGTELFVEVGERRAEDDESGAEDVLDQGAFVSDALGVGVAERGFEERAEVFSQHVGAAEFEFAEGIFEERVVGGEGGVARDEAGFFHARGYVGLENLAVGLRADEEFVAGELLDVCGGEAGGAGGGLPRGGGRCGSGRC
jgi:hypothetical protein